MSPTCIGSLYKRLVQFCIQLVICFVVCESNMPMDLPQQSTDLQTIWLWLMGSLWGSLDKPMLGWRPVIM